jgi:hypothetical protein
LVVAQPAAMNRQNTTAQAMATQHDIFKRLIGLAQLRPNIACFVQKETFLRVPPLTGLPVAGQAAIPDGQASAGAGWLAASPTRPTRDATVIQFAFLNKILTMDVRKSKL